ncbi:hypothetical protein DPMN_128093 [Dreissena polymorpha]|uniref:Uncharacterized protein n=1 Tax=Dreissena polymorpha TaxID=45954 RepID=A0A9D4H0G7_DREPO|nr:hypothetical protein DPMN_128093 [Dreissena polymorpha]
MFQCSSKVPDDDVLCPFCVSDKTREFKRVGDLRHHVKTKHPAEMEVAPKGLFSAKACFFFSINPLEYAKLHDVNKEISDEAQYARYLMAKWSTGRTPGIEERTSKWEEALRQPQRPSKRKATNSLFLIAIVTTLDSIKTFAESVFGVLQVRLSRNIFTDRRAVDNLKRRQSLVKYVIEPTGRWSTYPNKAPMIEEHTYHQKKG